MVGMRDVARKAGVSLSTVSLVVNGTGYVSADMRTRVEHAMRELDYIPNELARNLYKGRTNMIGMIVPSIRHPFFSTLTASIQHAFAKRGLHTMLCSTADVAGGETEYVDMLRRHMMDGIVMGAHTRHKSDYWTSIHRPIVAFDRYLGEGIASVGSDHEQGGRLIADILLKTGARSVATVGGPRAQFSDVVEWEASASGQAADSGQASASGQTQSSGSEAAANAASTSAASVGHASNGMAGITFPTVRYHLTLEHELVAAGARHEYIEAGEVDDLRAYAATMEHVCDRVAAGELDAVVSSDVGAAFCVQAALRRGIRIPEDLQIVAYDGTYLANAAGMSITAVRQNFEEISELIATRMVEAIRWDAENGRSARGKESVTASGDVPEVAVGDEPEAGMLSHENRNRGGANHGAGANRGAEPAAEGDVVSRAIGMIGDLVPVSLVEGDTVRGRGHVRLNS